MGLSLADIRARLKAQEEGKTNGRKRWKPKDEHTIRLLPLPGEEDLGYVVKWHYNVDNGRPMYCPTTHGDECPFCEFGAELKSWRDLKTGKDKPEAQRKLDWDFYKKIEAATKHYIPMVERKIVDKRDTNEVEGPFLWELTPKTYGTVLKICANDDWNDGHPEGGVLRILTSLTHGLDLNVSLKKKGEKGNNTSFDLTFVEERKKFTPIFKDDRAGVLAKPLIERIPTIGDVAKVVSSEEAAKVFASYQAGLTSDDGSSDKDAGREYSSHNGEQVGSGGADVDDVVSRLEQMIK